MRGNLANRIPWALAAVLVVAAPTMADLTATVKFFDSHGTVSGGEFLIQHNSFPFQPRSLGEDPSDRFETFCIEKNEYIHYNTTYYVEFSDRAVNGGVGGGGPNGDPLDVKTAYLYEQFITGQLDGYTFDTTVPNGLNLRVASANALQDIIWFIEQELGSTALSSLSGLSQHFYNQVVLHAGDNIGQVRVMNVWGDKYGTQSKQDQLVMVPTPTAATLGVLGIGLLGLLRRRIA